MEIKIDNKGHVKINLALPRKFKKDNSNIFDPFLNILSEHRARARDKQAKVGARGKR